MVDADRDSLQLREREIVPSIQGLVDLMLCSRSPYVRALFAPPAPAAASGGPGRGGPSGRSTIIFTSVTAQVAAAAPRGSSMSFFSVSFSL